MELCKLCMVTRRSEIRVCPRQGAWSASVQVYSWKWLSASLNYLSKRYCALNCCMWHLHSENWSALKWRWASKPEPGDQSWKNLHVCAKSCRAKLGFAGWYILSAAEQGWKHWSEIYCVYANVTQCCWVANEHKSAIGNTRNEKNPDIVASWEQEGETLFNT